MEIPRKTALEVLALEEGFSKEELAKAYKRLSKLTHPDMGGDANLFRFVVCCKEKLENEDNSYARSEDNTTDKNSYARSKDNTTNKNGKERGYITLTQLYEYFCVLNRIKNKYDIDYIRGTAIIYISPLIGVRECVKIPVYFSQLFSDFLELGFANFTAEIAIPEKLKKYNWFKVRVEFLDKTFNLIISKRKMIKVVKYERYLDFNSVLELHFKK